MTERESARYMAQRAADRRKRQAAALRANLKRRKEADATPQPPEAPEPETEP